jgi:AmiR/NasT family two-component response regulator
MTEGAARKSVVIAEDDFLVAREVNRALTVAGYEVVATAGDGAAAVALVAQHRPAVAVLDMAMPVLDGLGAARRIRDECPTPVVMLTAYDSPEFLAKAAEAGVGAYQIKPPQPAALQQAIEIAVARHADLMELRRLNAELAQALANVKELRGLLPICMHCKRIRNDQGYWERLEAYISQYADVQFSHGVCPECLRTYYPYDAPV